MIRISRATFAGWAALVAALPLPVSGAELPVRFGAHPTFDRMVFDWREPVEYRLDQNGESAVITFDRAAEIDQAALSSGLAKFSSRAEIETSAQRLVVRLTVPARTQLRHFRSGTKVVFDFARSAAAQSRELQAGAKPAGPQVAKTQQAAAASETAAPPTSTAGGRIRKPIPLRAVPDLADAPSQPTALAASAPLQAAPAATPVVNRVADVPVELVRTPDGHGLKFGWKEPVGAAVFGRGAHLWIAFDRRARLDVSSLKDKVDDLGAVETVETSGDGTVLRLSPAAGTGSAVRREGEAWVIDIGRLPRAPDVPIPVAARNAEDPKTSRLVLEMPGARSILAVRDPEMGDELAIAPTTAAGSGVEDERLYPQLRVFATTQGAAIQRRADGLSIRPLGNAVEVSANPGLFLSDPRTGAAARKYRGARAPALFDLAAWRREGAGGFNRNRQALHHAVAEAADDKRNAARLKLARFLFAYGHMEDVLGLLRLIEAEEPELVATAQLRAMRGVAALMSGDLEAAHRDLDHKSLDAQPEAALWRGALAMAEGNALEARAQMGRSADMYRDYPAPFANRLNLWHAEARLLTNDLPGAEMHIDAVLSGQPSPSERAQALYLSGRVQLAHGDRDGALGIWAGLENTPPTPGRTAAMLDRIDLLVEDGKMTPADAVPILDRLRFSWRGDALEFRTLARLGHFQIAIQEHRNGLNSLRKALELFPKHRDAPRITAEMMDAFAALVSGADTRVAPVTVIALFDEFQDLIPKGERGDELKRHLADRLIAVDLLERAAEILDKQVKETLSGEPKARTGAKLALVRLLDGKAEAALEALKASEIPDAPAELTRERRRLEARALADLGQTAAAMERLAGDESSDADTLRVDISWRARDWAAAADALQRLVGAPPPAGAALADDKARRAIHLAVARSLSGDREGLKRIDEQFGAILRKGPYKDIYQVIVSDAGAPVGDVREIAARTAAAAPFQSFLASYRQRVLAAAPKAGS